MLNPRSGYERTRWRQEKLTRSGLSREALRGSLLIFLLFMIILIVVAIRLQH